MRDTTPPSEGTRDANAVSPLPRSERADARENRERILQAARQIFAERGSDAPLEEIARRAGVGIATLYRRFPDRTGLMRGVALDVWRRATHEVKLALAEEPDAFHALARYMHRALDLRIGAVMPVLAGQAPLDDEVRAVRDQSAGPLQTVIERAHAEGTLRPDVAFGDIGLLIIRLSRPYLNPFPHDLDDRLAHRHLDLLLDGMRQECTRLSGALPGPSMTLADFTALTPDAEMAPLDQDGSRQGTART